MTPAVRAGTTVMRSQPVGLRYVISPTTDWKHGTAAGAYVWTAYIPRPDGDMDRHQGFAASEPEARTGRGCRFGERGLAMPDVDARALATRLKERMDNPPAKAPSFYDVHGEGDAWLAGYRCGVNRARIEIGRVVQEQMTAEDAPNA